MEASKDLQYPNKAGEADSTFIGFPYDFFGVPIKGTKINETELTDLIEKLLPDDKEAYEDAKQVFGTMENPFELTKFLKSLTDIRCRAN